MPCLSGKFDPTIGPIIDIGVYKHEIHVPPAAENLSTGVDTSPFRFPTLIDTGASRTCISPMVAKTIGLKPIGLTKVISATHSVPMNLFLVNLFLPFGTAGLFVPGIQVLEFNPGGDTFHGLLGRDILCKGVLTLSFDGHFSLCL